MNSKDIEKVAVLLGMEDANAIKTLQDLREYMAPNGRFETIYERQKEEAERNGKTFDANNKNMFKQTFLNSVGLFNTLRTKFLFGEIPGFFHEIKRPIDTASFDTLNGNSEENQKEISDSFPKKVKDEFVTGIFVLVSECMKIVVQFENRSVHRRGNLTLLYCFCELCWCLLYITGTKRFISTIVQGCTHTKRTTYRKQNRGHRALSFVG